MSLGAAAKIIATRAVATLVAAGARGPAAPMALQQQRSETPTVSLGITTEVVTMNATMTDQQSHVMAL